MNKSVVYDKAKWHFEAENFPKNLDVFQGYVHTGFYLGWLVENNLVEELINDYREEVKEFKDGKITGPKLFEKIDGVLSSDDLTQEGNEFTQKYFDFSNGKYPLDYAQAFTPGFFTSIFIHRKLPSAWSIYAVEDTKENYLKIKKIIDDRYKSWRSER